MQERLQTILDEIKKRISDENGKINTKAIVKIGIILALVIAISFFAALMLNKVNYGVLYTGLDESEAIEIITVLEEQQMPYDRKGGTIYVPDDKVDFVKVQLASKGYPKTGFTYDIFKNNVDLMSTNFQEYKYAQFELESRMARTIEQFDGVDKATVTIAMGNEQKYVLEENKKETSAAVTVVMNDGGSPSKKQVRGIQRLVAKGVPGLKVENVVVIDGNGEELQSSFQDSQEGSLSLKLNVEKQIEKSISSKVLYLLKPYFGDDNIRVTVNCSVDIDKKIKEIIQYIPSKDNKGVLSSLNSSYEVQGNGQVQAGVPGTETNADIPVYPGVTTDGDEIYFRDDRALEYLVSQVKEQIQSDTGKLKDVTVSVAVDSKDLTNGKAEELKSLIALTAGIDSEIAEQKVAIFNAEFFKPEPPEINTVTQFIEANPILKIIIPTAVVLLLLLILMIVLIIRKAKEKKYAAKLAEEEAKRAKETEDLVNLDELGMTREEELKKQIQDFTDMNPNIAAQLLKTWLRGEEGFE